MGIRQQGGIFGRNPTFNNVTVDGILTVDQIVEKTGAAGITLDGVTLKDGNIVLADGKGIDFSATSGTGTSELFDDYEEGSVINAFKTGGVAAPNSYTYLYTKVGRLVSCTFYAATGSLTLGATGALTLDLPFVVASGSGFLSPVVIFMNTNYNYPAGSFLTAITGASSATFITGDSLNNAMTAANVNTSLFTRISFSYMTT